MKPKIALVSGDFPPALSGIGDYVEKLAGALHKLGGDVTVITSQMTPQSTPYKVLPVMPGWQFGNRHQLIDLLGGFDIAHLQYPSTAYGRSLMINVLPTLLRRKHPHVKSLVTIHDFRVMRHRWRARVAPMLFGVDGLIYVDPRDGPYLKTYMPLSRPPTAIVPIAANAEPVPCTPADRLRWRTELGFEPDDLVVAFFGVFYPHKGLPELHQAIDNLRSQGKRARLLVLGDFDREADWRPAMEAQLKQPGVVWVKSAPLDRVSECLHAADLAALPFHSGASTNRGSLLATLAHGLPTVTTNGPCTPPDFGEQFDVSLVPIESAPALTGALEKLHDDAHLRDRMRKNSLAKMASMSWPAVGQQTLAFYDQLLGRPQPTGATLEVA